MRKLVLILTVFVLTSFTQSGDRTVYLCKGPESYAYHYKQDCRGLAKCSTRLEKTTESEAKKLKRKLCGWED
jgi:hypothetical protein